MRAWTIAARCVAEKILSGADSATRLFAARKTMKIFGLLLMLGLMSVMTAMLTAMSADASARLSLADKPRLVAPIVSAPDVADASVTQLASPKPATQTPRKKIKKRSLAACARVTSTCWGNA